MELSFLILPFLACLVLTGMHAWLGIHVLARGVIFVDLALAQIAALGAMAGLVAGAEPGTPASWLWALSFALTGAFVLSLTRIRKGRVPQEAVIGIVYAVASAAGVVLTARLEDVHGVERIQAILIGRSIVWVTPAIVLKTALLYGAVALVHVIFRRPFLQVSLDPEGARRAGRRLVVWDFLFYGTFALVITSSVQIAGVLLVFCYLIVPSVFGAVWAEGIGTRLVLAWAFGALASALGLLMSWELPSGPVITVVFGGLLLLSAAARRLRSGTGRAPALPLGALGLALVLLPRWLPELLALRRSGPAAEVSAAAERIDPAAVARALRSGDALEIDKALALLAAHPEIDPGDALFEAFEAASDPDQKIHLAEEGLRRRDRRFLDGLVAILLEPGDGEAPGFFAGEAAHVLTRRLDYAFPAELDAAAVAAFRRWWRAHRTKLRWDEGRHRFTAK